MAYRRIPVKLKTGICLAETGILGLKDPVAKSSASGAKPWLRVLRFFDALPAGMHLEHRGHART
jgi:hypothetical protein